MDEICTHEGSTTVVSAEYTMYPTEESARYGGLFVFSCSKAAETTTRQ